jgi:hypothetical protein
MTRIFAKALPIVAALCLPAWAHAAALYVQPSSANVSAGSSISVSVMLDSGGEAVNTAEGSLVFPSDLFDVVSVDAGSSIMSIWIQAPAYGGGSEIAFNGGIPSPGYAGSAGKIFSVVLRARAAGAAALSIAGGSVRANDGLGTDVLSASRGASIAIAPAASAQPAGEPAPAAKRIAIASATHPSQDAWYSSRTAELSWDLPAGAISVQTLLSRTEGQTPSVSYTPPIDSKTIDGLEDGVWYFNLRARTSGGWGPVASYRLQTDSEPPNLSGARISYDPAASAVVFDASALRAEDSVSGIARYEAVVDGAAAGDIPPGAFAQGTYSLPVRLSAGGHTAALRAVDRAGNAADSQPQAFTVEEERAAIAAPAAWLSPQGLLLASALALSFLSILMNAILWTKLRRQEKAAAKKARPAGSKVRRDARQKLLSLRRDLQKQAKDLERATVRQGVAPEDAAYIQKVRQHLSDAEAFLGKKIQDVEEP